MSYEAFTFSNYVSARSSVCKTFLRNVLSVTSRFSCHFDFSLTQEHVFGENASLQDV